jgi:hypothetical protein
MDGYAFKIVIDKIQDIKNPFEKNAELSNFYVLIEIGCNHNIDVLTENLYKGLTEEGKCF